MTFHRPETSQNFASATNTVLAMGLPHRRLHYVYSPVHLSVCLSHVIAVMFVTRHSLVERRARYLFYCMYFCIFVCMFGQRFLDNPQADSRQSSHAGVLWFRMCLLPFWGLAAPGGRKNRQMKFSLLWESMGNFCILAVFERYLSNACTDPHQILFV